MELEILSPAGPNARPGKKDVSPFSRVHTVDLEQRLRNVFESVFGSEAENISDDDGPGTMAGWDSVGHLNLILAIEAEFGVQFETSEIPDLLSLGQIRARLEFGC